MCNSFQFEKFEYEEITMFKCKDSGWQLSKEHGLHKCSPARDYFVKWVEYDGKWSLYITSYNSISSYDLSFNVNNFIVTVPTLFDIFDYICENKHTHY